MTARSEVDKDIASQILEHRAKEREAIGLLLDRFLSTKDRILTKRIQMGGTEAYVGAVTLEWFAQRVRFAAQLPLFDHSKDPITDKIIIDADTIEKIEQRPLNWDRGAPLALY